MDLPVHFSVIGFVRMSLFDTQEVRNWLVQPSMKKVSYTDFDGLEISETFKCKVKFLPLHLLLILVKFSVMCLYLCCLMSCKKYVVLRF